MAEVQIKNNVIASNTEANVKLGSDKLVFITIGRVSIWMERREARDFARNIRKAHGRIQK